MALGSKSFYFGPKILHECLKTAVFGVFDVDKNIIPLKVFSCHKDQILPL